MFVTLRGGCLHALIQIRFNDTHLEEQALIFDLFANIIEFGRRDRRRAVDDFEQNALEVVENIGQPRFSCSLSPSDDTAGFQLSKSAAKDCSSLMSTLSPMGKFFNSTSTICDRSR